MYVCERFVLDILDTKGTVWSCFQERHRQGLEVVETFLSGIINNSFQFFIDQK